ncbi:MAG: ZIP family metal transporter [Chloroflexota bacterium]
MFWESLSVLQIGLLASLTVGLATAVGALPVFLPVQLKASTRDVMLGGAAGVMLAATSFSLIVPALEHGGGGVQGATAVVVGMALGAILLDLMDQVSPHQHFIKGREGGDPGRLARVWLFIIAISLHNFPEGLAVGVGFGTGDVGSGLAVALGIGLQNLPEGLAVALSLLGEGYTRSRSFLVALLTGIIEPVGGIIGLVVVQFSQPVLPYALAFAAGAMLFVISHEIIPETHRNGHDRLATYSLVCGFLIMMFLDTTLG